MRYFLAFPVLAIVALGAPASADPPANTIMKVTPPGPPRTDDMDPVVICTHKMQVQIQQLGALQAQLKLSDAQKAAFEAWKKSRVDLWRGIPCPALPMGLEIPAPKRIENQIATMSASLEGLKKELPSTEALYKVLTPAQKAIFDGPMHMPTAPVPGASKPGN